MTTPDPHRDRLAEWHAAATDAAADAFLEAQAAVSRGDHRAARRALGRLESVADGDQDAELLAIGRQLRSDLGIDPLLFAIAVASAVFFFVVGRLITA